MELLVAENLNKSFGGLAAVQDITLKVPKGKVVSLIGPNGAGKTTVFNLLTGFYNMDSGRIFLDGEELSHLRAYNFICKGMARTFQNLRLFSSMTVIENVLVGYQCQMNYGWLSTILGGQKKKRGENAAIEHAREALQQVGLSKYEKAYCKNLPYGLQKKLEIARALVSKPKVILLDEPAAGLNPQETLELSRFIRSLLATGVTIFLIEHDMNLVMGISDYVYVMDHGIMLAEGLPCEIQRNQQVIEAYIGKKGMKNAVAGM